MLRQESWSFPNRQVAWHTVAMIKIRKANERAHVQHGWLDAYHTFSFADYDDPQWRSFRSLRVINDDLIMPGMGFGTHPHRDMEIITYLLSGALEHKDSMGNGRVIRTGELQYMSAGSGVRHSEFNPSKDEATHLLQIWIEPDARNVKPRYAEKSLQDADGGKLHLMTSKTGRQHPHQSGRRPLARQVRCQRTRRAHAASRAPRLGPCGRRRNCFERQDAFHRRRGGG
jgi:redox-sensitive bicupin YhaK (pirin superfamily)